ncbi:hypothetical protein [Paenibacillus soyae]|uniref:Uncharacterized protein n=1 Tax=Paenibacillus soyae TaxID=2969249 RepID=A0A9X2MS10_9BACL|nr:hypothetical protein [Paenibacillus soyae]MCR2805202.1 hypothetical protein [Paenibacillus soyae]
MPVFKAAKASIPISSPSIIKTSLASTSVKSPIQPQAVRNTNTITPPTTANVPKVQTTLKSSSSAHSSIGTTYTINREKVISEVKVGANIDLKANTLKTNPVTNTTSTTTSKPKTEHVAAAPPLTANEQILKAKQDYEAAQAKGDKAGMAAASKLADEARKNGGTISSNVTLNEAKVIVANEQVIKAKQDYANAEKIGNTAEMQAAKSAAAVARRNGATITSNVTLEEAKIIVANETIVQAKKDYAIAEKTGDMSGKQAAKEVAAHSRENGGTISADVTLTQAEKILEQIKWAAQDPSAPMDFVGIEDELTLLKEARKNADSFGVDKQVELIDKTIADLNEAIEKLSKSKKQTDATVIKLKDIMKQYEKEVGDKLKELDQNIDKNKKEIETMIAETNELIKQGKILANSAEEFIKTVYNVCDVDSMSGGSEQRGTVLEEAMSGFFSGLWSSWDSTLDFAFYAFDNPADAGKQVINGAGDTAVDVWNKLTNPKTTYEAANQEVQEFMMLSEEDKARTFGFILSQMIPTRRLDLLNPNENKDGGESVGGNNSSGGSSGVGGTPGDRLPRYTEEEIQQILKDTESGIKNHPLRQAYEIEVAGLAQNADNLLKQGKSETEVAKILHQARREIGVKYKDVTPEALRNYIYSINMNRYGDPLGPTYEFLKLQGKSDADIIRSASRPNPDVNSLLAGFELWLRGQTKS